MWANPIGPYMPIIAHIVPIITHGISINENSGRNIKLPSIPYIGISPKCVNINGAVNMVAIKVVRNAEYIYFNILLLGRFGLTQVHSHNIPNIAAKDN